MFVSQCYNFNRLIRNHVPITIFVDSSRVSRVLGNRPLSRGSLHCLPEWRKYTHQLAIEDCILFRARVMSNCYSIISVLMRLHPVRNKAKIGCLYQSSCKDFSLIMEFSCEVICLSTLFICGTGEIFGISCLCVLR